MTLTSCSQYQLTCLSRALEGQINGHNVKRIKTRILAEGANNPVTNEADKVLIDNGVFPCPGCWLTQGAS